MRWNNDFAQQVVMCIFPRLGYNNIEKLVAVTELCALEMLLIENANPSM